MHPGRAKKSHDMEVDLIGSDRICGRNQCCRRRVRIYLYSRNAAEAGEPSAYSEPCLFSGKLYISGRCNRGSTDGISHFHSVWKCDISRVRTIFRHLCGLSCHGAGGTLKVIPVLVQRVKLATGLPLVILALALGKAIACFYQLYFRMQH